MLNISCFNKKEHSEGLHDGTTTNFIIHKGRYEHIDPTHPASRVLHKDLQRVIPSVRNDAFILNVRPKAALWVPDTVWPDPPYTLKSEPLIPWISRKPGTSSKGREAGGRQGKGDKDGVVGEEVVQSKRPWEKGEVVNMSLIKVIGKNTSKSAVIRKKIGAKLKMAVRLVVTRGASAVEVGKKGKSKLELRCDEEDAGAKWILRGTSIAIYGCHNVDRKNCIWGAFGLIDWTYMVIPRLEVYRMPMPQLVQEMRVALQAIYEKAQRLEAYWEKNNAPLVQQNNAVRTKRKVFDGEKTPLDGVIPFRNKSQQPSRYAKATERGPPAKDTKRSSPVKSFERVSPAKGPGRSPPIQDIRIVSTALLRPGS